MSADVPAGMATNPVTGAARDVVGLVATLTRAAEQENLNAALQRGAIADGLDNDGSAASVLAWCEKKAAAFREAADALTRLSGEGDTVVVPREPTEAMLDAFVARALQVSIYDEGSWTNYARNQWAQMIAAAPGQAR